MKTHRMQVQDLVGQRRDWTRIAIQFDFNTPAPPRLLELAKERRWQLLDMSTTRGELPKNPAVRGAMGIWLPTSPEVREFRRHGIPAVRIGNWPHPEDHLLPAVMHDRPAAGRLAAEHFAERNFEHIAFVGRNPWREYESVYRAMADRAEELGCQCRVLQEDIDAMRSLVTADHKLLHVRQEAFTRWLTDQTKPLGLFTFGNHAASLYSQWILDAGLRVPEDVAVLGNGNQQFVCEVAPVPLSSVAYDDARLAQTAVQMLEQLMANRMVENTTVKIPPAGIVTRQSTDVLAASDPNVVEALRFMWNHLTEDLSVEQIARHVGVSRRTLERAFQQCRGTGIYHEFQRRRLDRACELLTLTDWRIGRISDTLRFSSPTYFSEAFSTAFGMSPSKYRQRHS